MGDTSNWYVIREALCARLIAMVPFCLQPAVKRLAWSVGTLHATSWTERERYSDVGIASLYRLKRALCRVVEPVFVECLVTALAQLPPDVTDAARLWPYLAASLIHNRHMFERHIQYYRQDDNLTSSMELVWLRFVRYIGYGIPSLLEEGIDKNSYITSFRAFTSGNGVNIEFLERKLRHKQGIGLFVRSIESIASLQSDMSSQDIEPDCRDDVLAMYYLHAHEFPTIIQLNRDLITHRTLWHFIKDTDAVPRVILDPGHYRK